MQFFMGASPAGGLEAALKHAMDAMTILRQTVLPADVEVIFRAAGGLLLNV